MIECCLVRILPEPIQVLSQRLQMSQVWSDGARLAKRYFSVNVMDHTKILSGPDRQARPVNHATSHCPA
jgi:hypothetical protein